MYRFVFVAFVFISSYGWAQNYVLIEGAIKDDGSLEKIPYSHVVIERYRIGTVANEDGQFLFKIPKYATNDTVSISAIGYKTANFVGSSLIDSGFLELMLTPEPKVLDEVLIKPIEPTTLLKEVVDRIPTNYGTRPSELIGFYRETVKIDNEYHSYLEGVINAFKTSYEERGTKSDQVRIIKGRKRKNGLSMNSTKSVPQLNAGPVTFNSYDVVKRRRNFLNPKQFKHYQYELADITTYKGHDVYIIGFEGKKNSKKGIASGNIYIDIDSKAVLKTEYTLNDTGLEIVNKKNIRHDKRSNVFVTAKSLTSVVTYDFQNNLWAMSQLRVNIGFNYFMKNEQKTEDMDIALNIITTESTHKNAQPFSKEEIFSSNQAFVHNLGQEDPEFWENYNVLKEEQKLKEAFQNFD